MKTLNEVIKALEMCTVDECVCIYGCPYSEFADGDDSCEYHAIPAMQKDALIYLKMYKELAGDSEAFAEWKENPPLTWDKLCELHMIGEPVWNSHTRMWMLIIDSASDGTWVDLVNHAGGKEHWMWYDLRKNPLYRKEKK